MGPTPSSESSCFLGSFAFVVVVVSNTAAAATLIQLVYKPEATESYVWSPPAFEVFFCVCGCAPCSCLSAGCFILLKPHLYRYHSVFSCSAVFIRERPTRKFCFCVCSSVGLYGVGL